MRETKATSILNKREELMYRMGLRQWVWESSRSVEMVGVMKWWDGFTPGSILGVQPRFIIITLKTLLLATLAAWVSMQWRLRNEVFVTLHVWIIFMILISFHILQINLPIWREQVICHVMYIAKLQINQQSLTRLK